MYVHKCKLASQVSNCNYPSVNEQRRALLTTLAQPNSTASERKFAQSVSDRLQPPYIAQRGKKKLTQAFAQPPNGTASEGKFAQSQVPTACSRPKHSEARKNSHKRSHKRRTAARDPPETQFHLHSAPSTRSISAEGCPHSPRNSVSPSFRAFDTLDLRRGLPALTQKFNFTFVPRLRRAQSPQRVAQGHPQKRNFTCIPRLRHKRSPQRVAQGHPETQFHLHSAPSTCTISAEGCPRDSRNAISPTSAPSTRTISAEGCIISMDTVGETSA